MRWPQPQPRPQLRPRLTVRRMMIAVAVVAVVMGVWSGLWRRSLRFERIAESHCDRIHIPDLNAPEESLRHRLVVYHDAIAVKYYKASEHPWLPVPPDPPEPK